MHITSNISLLDRMVANYSALSNLLYSSELDRMGGGDSPFAKYNCADSAYYIIPSISVHVTA